MKAGISPVGGVASRRPTTIGPATARRANKTKAKWSSNRFLDDTGVFSN